MKPAMDYLRNRKTNIYRRSTAVPAVDEVTEKKVDEAMGIQQDRSNAAVMKLKPTTLYCWVIRLRVRERRAARLVKQYGLSRS